MTLKDDLQYNNEKNEGAEDKLARFSCQGPGSTYLGSAGHMLCVALPQLCFVAQKP